jgi:phosphatidylglycerophosphatase A
LHRAARHWIAVVGGCGYVPLAPGTAGSAAGAVLFLIFLGIGTGATWMFGSGDARIGPVALAAVSWVLIGIVTVVGVWASDWAERDFGRADDGRIVIDELVGQWVALSPLVLIVSAGSSFFSVVVGVVTGFVLFRVFDVWKPGAVGWAEKRFEGGWGVMADDLVAGVYAAGACIVLAALLELASPGFAVSVSAVALPGHAVALPGHAVALPGSARSEAIR